MDLDALREMKGRSKHFRAIIECQAENVAARLYGVSSAAPVTAREALQLSWQERKSPLYRSATQLEQQEQNHETCIKQQSLL